MRLNTLSTGRESVEQESAPQQPTSAATTAGPPTIWLLDEPHAGSTRFLAEHPGATLYHTVSWHSALRAAGVGTPYYLLATLGNEVAGVFPLYESNAAGGQRRLLSLPATPAAGVLSDDDATRWLLESRALALAEARGVDGVWVRTFERSAPDDRRRAGTELDWVRLPLERLPAAWHASKADERVAIELGPFGVQEARAFRRAGNDIPGELLRALVADRSVALHGAYIRRGGRRRALGVWTITNAHVHVLALAADAIADGLVFAFLASVAEVGLARAAERIDFPCPLAPDARMLAVLQSAAVEIARERRLDPADR